MTNLESALSKVRVGRTPFPYFSLSSLFDETVARDILNWLEFDAPWSPVQRDFYTRCACVTVAQLTRGTPAEVVAAPITLEILRTHMEMHFDTRLSASRIDILGQQLLPGHRIGIHNANPHGDPPTETHRLIVNFNRGFDDSNGGHMVLLDVAP